MIQAAFLSVLLCAGAVASAGNRAALTYAGPAEKGQAQLQVEISARELASALGAQPAAGRFRAVVTNGDARVLRSRSFASGEGTMHTVLAFDRSGSFRSHWDDAFALADIFAENMPGDGSVTVSVMTFHSNQRIHGSASSPGELRSLLVMVRELNTLGSSSETSLMSAIRTGSKHAAEEQASSGARQLIIFSDAGEEGSIFQLDETVRYARRQGTPVYPIILKSVTSPNSTSAQRFATANDRMKKIAEETGGQHIHAADASIEARARLASHATAIERLYWLDVSFCGVSSADARFADQIYVDVIDGPMVEASTDPARFTQHAGGSALLSCVAAPPEPVADSSQPVAELPVIVDPPASTRSGPSPLEELFKDSSGLLLGGGLALLLMLMLLRGGGLALFLLLRRRPKEQTPDAPEPAPEPVAEPVSTQQAEPEDLSPDWHDPLAPSLPETRLVILAGADGMEGFYRIHKREFVLGADAARGVDLVFQVPQISGRHATVQLYGSGAVYVMDHSTNGTFVDGRRLKKGERRQVFPGQVIGLSSRVRMRVEQPGHAPLAPPPRPQSAPSLPSPSPSPSPSSLSSSLSSFSSLSSSSIEAGPVPPPEPAASPPQKSRSRQKTIYGPIDGSPPEPPPAPPQPVPTKSPRRKRSRTIIQPLRRDDEQ
jgi:hypothetical protein